MTVPIEKILRYGGYFAKGIKIVAKSAEKIVTQPVSSTIDVIDYLLGVKKEIQDEAAKKKIEEEIENLRMSVEQKFSGLDERIINAYTRLSSKAEQDNEEEIFKFQQENNATTTPMLFQRTLIDLLKEPRYRIKNYPLNAQQNCNPENVHIAGIKNGRWHIYEVPLGQLASMQDMLGQPRQEENLTIPLQGLESDVVVGKPIKQTSKVIISSENQISNFEVKGKQILRGKCKLRGKIFVPKNTELHIAPGTSILCSPESAIYVEGKLITHGEKDKKIQFDSGKKEEKWLGISAKNAELVFNHTTIRNTENREINGEGKYLSAITVLDSKLDFRNSKIQYAYSEYLGAGIGGLKGIIKITNSEFEHCESQTYGGAIFMNDGNIDILETKIISCKADTGGGICLDQTGGKIYKCKIRGNIARQGSGVLIVTAKMTTIQISHTQFVDNIGGATLRSSGGNLELYDSEFRSNNAGEFPLIFSAPYEKRQPRSVTIKRNQFSRNTALSIIASTDPLTLDECVFTGNKNRALLSLNIKIEHKIGKLNKTKRNQSNKISYFDNDSIQ